jgi:minor extracellular serine protease Vpr
MPGNIKQAVLFLSILFPFMLSAQTIKNANKIDLPFRILIEQQKASDSATKKKSKTSNPKKSPNTEKKYECIIYTKNPSVLRKKGITVQSELPAFVTALATLSQIEQVAAMPEVTFIEAPEQLKTHSK